MVSAERCGCPDAGLVHHPLLCEKLARPAPPWSAHRRQLLLAPAADAPAAAAAQAERALQVTLEVVHGGNPWWRSAVAADRSAPPGLVGGWNAGMRVSLPAASCAATLHTRVPTHVRRIVFMSSPEESRGFIPWDDMKGTAVEKSDFNWWACLWGVQRWVCARSGQGLGRHGPAPVALARSCDMPLPPHPPAGTAPPTCSASWPQRSWPTACRWGPASYVLGAASDCLQVHAPSGLGSAVHSTAYQHTSAV